MSEVLSLVDRVQERVSIIDQALQVMNVGPVTSEFVTLRENAAQAALGWRFFQDATYSQNGLLVPAGVRTQIPDDGRGMIANAWGTDSSGWLRASNGRLYPDDPGDVFFYRLNLTFTPTINNTPYLIDFDIGTANRVYNQRRTLAEGAGFAVPDSFELLSLCAPAMKLNGGAFYITPKADVYLSKISIAAFKAYSGRAR